MSGGLPGLGTRWLGRRWEHLEQVDSTNDECKRRSGELPQGAAVTASLQTAGKGRLGKQWNVQAGSGLALSFLLRGGRVEEMGQIPLLAGLAVCRALEDHCGVSCGLKWSNDVLCSGKKLCGILCESRLDGLENTVVVGIGVNLLQTAEQLESLGLVYATSLLLATGKRWEAPPLAAAILNTFEPLWEQFRAEGFEPIRLAYRERCVTLGKEVRVLYRGEEKQGVALEIGPDGSLLCRIDGAIRPVLAGEASVRGLYGYH